MNYDVFIPVRLRSSRLPEKQLKKINGIPLLKLLVQRLEKSSKKRKIVVCTSIEKSDDKLVSFLKQEGIEYFRGSENDILQRFLDAAEKFQTDVIIDVEGDKIYTDPYYVDKIIDTMENSNYDYVEGGILNENEPLHGIHGFVPAGIRTSALKKVCQLKTTENTDTGYKEFFHNKELFKSKVIFSDSKLRFPKNLRLTLDYPEDLELAKEVYGELGNDFNLEDVIGLFGEKPILLKITDPLIERWGKNYQENLTNLSFKD